MWVWIVNNWERTFLFLLSLVFLAFCIWSFSRADVAGATTAFVMFFLCLIYSNVARFKRFKGLGFEAELWEDKQKEAADLIERLKSIVQVYTREIVMMKVMSGRWGGTAKWTDRWALFEELVGQHDTLGQEIDFLPLKESVYRVMVFDAVSPISGKIQSALTNAQSKARDAITAEFGPSVSDLAGHKRRNDELSSIDTEMTNIFEVAQKQNVAKFVLEKTEKAVQDFKVKFEIDVELPADEVRKLRQIDELIEVGDFNVDPQLIKWADRHD